MLPRAIDAYRVLPELVWCGFGVLVMLMQPFVRSRHFFSFLAMIGTLAGTAASVTAAMRAGPGFGGLVQSDSFSFFFRLLVGTVAFLVVLAAGHYLERERLPFAEFYSLLLFAAAGMGVLASAQELLTAFIGLEMSSISSYVLAGYRRDALKSNESAMKYFLLGSFATAFFLYGIALVYGASGTTMLVKMDSAELFHSTLFELGLAMILIGLGFKVAAAPFQVWTPDVYEGAPTPVTALFSAGPKAAAFALLLRIFATVPAATHFWFWAFWALAALTMFAGNLGALVQTNVKRLLAYSSIAHAGYILVAFAAVTSMAQGEGGAANASPAYAAVLLYLLSLLGLPVTAGFFGKFYIFKAAVNSHLLWLAALMAVNSVIGAYYYLRVIVVMYMRESSTEATALGPVRFPIGVSVVLLVTFAGTILFGVYPNPVINFILQPTLLGR